MLACTLGHAVGLTEQCAGTNRETLLEVDDGDVELAFERLDVCVDSSEAGFDGGEDFVHLAAPCTDLVVERGGELATACLGLLHGQHDEPDGHVRRVFGNVGDCFGVDLCNIDLGHVDLGHVDLWHFDLGQIE